MSDIESINSAQSKHFNETNNEDFISRSNSYNNASSNPHSIFERTVEESLSNTPMLMHHAQRRLSRTNSIVSFSNSNIYGSINNNTSQPITINANSRSGSNLSNLYRTSSQASVNRRTSVISTHRHNENYIAPSIDSACPFINDNNTTIDDIDIEDHPLSTSASSMVSPDSPNNSIFSPPGAPGSNSNINKSSPGSSPTAMIKGPLSRRPSTIGLDMALGVHREHEVTNHEQQSPPLRLNSFGSNNAINSGINSNAGVSSGLNSSLADSSLPQGNSPRLVRFQSYADILSEESSSLRRPSFGSANNSSLSVQPQTSQSSHEGLEFQFGKQPSLLKKNAASPYPNFNSSNLSSPLHASTSPHPLKNSLSEGKKDLFEKVTPQEYKKFTPNEKSPFHQLSNKE